MNSFQKSLCAVLALFASEALSFQYQRALLQESENALADQERLKHRAGVIQTVVVDSLKVRNNFIANYNRPQVLAECAQDGLTKCRSSVAELQKLGTECGKDETAERLVSELATCMQALEPLLQEVIANSKESTTLPAHVVYLVINKKLNHFLDAAFGIVKTLNAHDKTVLLSTTARDRDLREQQAMVLLLVLVFKALVALTVVIILSRDTSKKIKILLSNMSRLKNNRALNRRIKGNDEICLLDSEFHEMAEELNYFRKRDEEIFENVVDLIFTLDSDLNFVKISKSVWEFFDQSPGALEETSVLELTEGDQREQVKAQFENLQHSDESSSFELVFNIGSFVRVLLLTSKWAQDSEQFFCIAHDITERKAQEQLIAENEQRLRKILEALPIGITVSTFEGRLEFANDIACRLLNWNYQSLPQQNMPELIDEASRGSLVEVPASLALKRPLELSTTVFELSSGKRILSAFQDISARVELQNAKNTFLAMISHDIRTPLQTVSSFLENLQTGRFGSINSDLQSATSNLLLSTKLVNRLINDLLDVEKLESGSFLLAIQPVSLQGLIDEAIDAVDGLSAKHGVEIQCAIGADVTVDVDPERTVQVLVNIFSNAIKFSPADSVVKIVSEVNPTYTKIFVIDRGRGIPTDLQSTLFSKFRQAQKEDNKRDYGSGLGLAIAKLIVEAQGGTIGVESKVNQGSIFWFTVKSVKVNNLAANQY